MKISARPYQQRAVDGFVDWFDKNETGNPVIVFPTGGGKSILIAMICLLAAEYEQRSRILIVTPSKELCEQNLEKLLAVAPELRYAVVSASMGRKDSNAAYVDVVIGTVGSLVKNPGNLGRIDLILNDECHLIQRSDSGMYRDLISGCMRFNQDLRVAGLTATPFRGDGVWLTEGKDRLFTDIAVRVSIRELLDEGYLSPLVSVATETSISGDGIRTSGGDYVIHELAARLDQAELTEKIAAEIVGVGRAQGRKKWLAFCVTVQHAEHMAEALQARGVKAAVVHGKTPKAERERIIREFRAGRLECLTTVLALLTGFDVPDIDLIAWVRNTRSPVLWLQGCGRGLRIAPGKTDCAFLDFTDTALTLGPIDTIKGRAEPKPKDKESGAPFRICDECGANNPASARQCVQCGTPFPDPEPKISHFSNGAAVLSGANKYGYTEVNVTDVFYKNYQSRNTGKIMLKVEYMSGMRLACSEFVCLEHEGFARSKAEKWWNARHQGQLKVGVPTTVLQAMGLVEFLAKPSSITLKQGEKYPEIVSVKFESKEAA